NGAFQQLWSTLIDPSSRFVNPSERKPAGRVWSVIENGAPSDKVDILVIAEGYTEGELPKFHKDVERLVGRLFATEPFKSRKKDFNVRALDLVEPVSGVNRPRTHDDRRTATGVEYNIFDSERYVLTLDDHRMRDVASSAPYDFLEILVNEKTYGGGGIFNDQATACVDSAFAEYVFVHEFGHHFAALADEYYTSPVSYETTGGSEHPEPWEPNVTANGAHPKWATDKDVPLPTPGSSRLARRGPAATPSGAGTAPIQPARTPARPYLVPSTNWFPSESLKIAEVPHDSVFGSWTNSTPRAFSSSYVFCTLSH